MNRQFGGVMVAVLGVVLLIGGLRGTWQKALHALWTDLPAPSGGGGGTTPPEPDPLGRDLVCPPGYWLRPEGDCTTLNPDLPAPIPATRRTTAGVVAGAPGSYVKTA